MYIADVTAAGAPLESERETDEMNPAESVNVVELPARPKRQNYFEKFGASRLALVPLEDEKWLVRGLIPAETLVTMVANEGGGKTMLALDLAYRVAGGGAPMWCGQPIETKGAVAFLGGESSTQELRRRWADIAGDDWDTPHPVMMIPYLSTQPPMTLFDDECLPTRHFEDILGDCKAAGAVLLIVDPLKVALPFDLNDNDRCYRALNRAAQLAAANGLTILFLAHTNKMAGRAGVDDRAAVMGAGAIQQASRQVLMLSAAAKETAEATAKRLSCRPSHVLSIRVVKTAFRDALDTSDQRVLIRQARGAPIEVTSAIRDPREVLLRDLEVAIAKHAESMDWLTKTGQRGLHAMAATSPHYSAALKTLSRNRFLELLEMLVDAGRAGELTRLQAKECRAPAGALIAAYKDDCQPVGAGELD